MKKLLIVLLVAVLALALVACGGPADTTPAQGGDDTTAAPGNDTTAAPGGDDTTAAPGGDDTTAAPGGDETTPDEGGDDDDRTYADLINDIDFMCLGVLNSVDFYIFEDFHGALDNNIAMVFTFNDAGGVYTDLFLDTTVEGATPYANEEYDWVITLDGKDYPIERFSLFNNGTSGWVRCDMGAEIKWSDFEWDDDNQHGFMAELKIYDSSKTLYYYADLNPYGPTMVTRPAAMEMIEDTDRPANVTQVGISQLEAISGPDSGNGEGFQKLFDGKVGTKICTGNDGDEGAVVVKYNGLGTVVGVSIVNANDNNPSTGRTLVAFEVYGSNDAESWTPLYTATGLDADGNAIDKSTCNTNYLEMYHAIENNATYSYFKLVPRNGEMWQVSEFLLWIEQ